MRFRFAVKTATVGGATAVLVMQPQATLLSSIETGHPLRQQHPVLLCEAVQRWNWDDVEFEGLHPSAGD